MRQSQAVSTNMTPEHQPGCTCGPYNIQVCPFVCCLWTQHVCPRSVPSGAAECLGIKGACDETE